MNAKYIICEVEGKGIIPVIFFNDLHKNIYDWFNIQFDMII